MRSLSSSFSKYSLKNIGMGHYFHLASQNKTLFISLVNSRSIISLICTSAAEDRYPVLSHPESSWGAPLGLAAGAEGLIASGILCLLKISSLA